MAAPNTAEEAYKLVADVIWAEKPEAKQALNEAARNVVRMLRESMTESVSDRDVELALQLVAFTMSGIMAVQTGKLSDHLDFLFDTYSLAAGSVAGAIDLADESPPTDAADIAARAQKLAESRTATVDDTQVPGQYL